MDTLMNSTSSVETNTSDASEFPMMEIIWRFMGIHKNGFSFLEKSREKLLKCIHMWKVFEIILTVSTWISSSQASWNPRYSLADRVNKSRLLTSSQDPKKLLKTSHKGQHLAQHLNFNAMFEVQLNYRTCGFSQEKSWHVSVPQKTSFNKKPLKPQPPETHSGWTINVKFDANNSFLCFRCKKEKCPTLCDSISDFMWNLHSDTCIQVPRMVKCSDKPADLKFADICIQITNLIKFHFNVSRRHFTVWLTESWFLLNLYPTLTLHSRDSASNRIWCITSCVHVFSLKANGWNL